MRIPKKRIASFLITPLLAGLVLTVLAPFGTHNFSLLGRAAFWIGMSLAGGLGALSVQWAVKRWAPSITGWRYTLLQSLGATLSVAPFVIGGFGYGFGQTSPASLLMTLFYIWVIAIVITAVGELAGRQTPSPEDESSQRPALMDRLPLQVRGADLYGVTSEDHYVRIRTSAGSHMVLMRLADVEGLARPVSGLSPHRSWWVAEDGVGQIKRDGSKFVIELKDGTDVPVSRAGAQRLREAGWLS